MDEVWSERDTSPARIAAALRDIETEHHHYSEHPLVPARVLNVVVVVEAEFRGEIENRLERVGRYHPSRLILCAIEPNRSTIDAWAGVGTDDAEGRPGPIEVARERMELLIGERHLAKLDTIVDPLLVSDLATMVWAPHGHTEAMDSLRRLAQIVLLDSQDQPTVTEGLARAADLSEAAYIVDLAWLRSTPWRERVAAAFDPPPFRVALAGVASVTVRHRAGAEPSRARPRPHRPGHPCGHPDPAPEDLEASRDAAARQPRLLLGNGHTPLPLRSLAVGRGA